MRSLRSFPVRSRQSGFALIVTVVLVAFLVLILVGLATFTRVETQVADNTRDVAEARQNATSALNIAIGQLQRHAGPDERVTATSEITGGIAAGNQNYFTGVWDTTAAIGGTPAAWLVSGTEGSASATATAGIADPSATVTQPYDDTARNVFVVYDASVGSSSAAERGRRIRLNKQAITAPASSLPGFASTDNTPTPIGNYAYWVGDEGVKASASVTAPSLSTLNYNNSGVGGDNWNGAATSSAELGASLKDRLSQFSLPRVRVEQFYPGIDYNAGSTPSELARLQNIEQIRFVTNSVNNDATELTNYRARFHDITVMSQGVLARTDAGTGAVDRLRRDWSGGVVAASAASTGINDYWVARPAVVSTATGTFTAIYDIAARKNTAGSALSFAIAPVLSEAGLFLDVAIGSGNNLELRAMIAAEFWNPYAATIRATGGSSLRVVVRNESAGALVFSMTDSDGTPHTITIPAGNDIYSGTVPAMNFAPGQIIQLNTLGSSADFSAGSSGFRATGFASASTVADPMTTTVSTYSFPTPIDAGDLVIELQETATGTVLQRYELPAWTANAGASAPGLGTPYAGYGFELSRTFSVWTGSKDPRDASFTTSDYESLGAGQRYQSSADQNTTVSFGSGAPLIASGATTPPPIILFDLPRQEITNVAQLRHMIGNRPYEIMGGAGASTASDRVLFDATFVSTVPRNYTWNFETEARPNRHLSVYIPSRAPAGEFDSAGNRLNSLRDPAISARFQMIRGAFNINSTSAAAWSAVLGSSLLAWDTTDDATSNVSRAFFRTPHGAQEKGLANLVISNVSGDTPAAPAAALLADSSALSAVGRRLTSAEIDDLAQRIVTELVTRGQPFASLGEFASSNVLSTAITNAGLNSLIATPAYQGASGAITSGDIIAAIAPFMAARSDTFKIRAYGDVQNPITGVVTGRAWCEAIVQRTPDLAPSPSDPNAATANAATVVRGNPSTYTFGRQFQIISFRWLNSDDI